MIVGVFGGALLVVCALVHIAKSRGAHHGDYDNMDFLRRQGAFDPPAAQKPEAVELRQAKRVSKENLVPTKTRATC